MVNIEEIYDRVPYIRTLGVTLTAIETERIRAELAYSPSLSTVGGGLHGGALMGLADITAAVCASAATGGGLPATATSATQFLRPIRSAATAVATPLHIGRTTVTVQVDITDDAGQLCVRVTQTVSVRAVDA